MAITCLSAVVTAGLDPTQLGQITFVGFGPGALLSSVGEVSPAGPVVTTLGDFNRDGHVNAADITAMEQALTDLNAYKTNYFLSTANLTAIGDFDGDSHVTNADLQGLMTLLASGGGSVAAVPEPASGVLLAAGILIVRDSGVGSRELVAHSRCKRIGVEVFSAIFIRISDAIVKSLTRGEARNIVISVK